MGPRCPRSSCQHLNMRTLGSVLRSNMLLTMMCAFVDRFPTWSHTGCASSLYTQSSSLSGNKTLQQYQVSKPCGNSLSGIQIKLCSSLTLRNKTLQQPNSFTYPNLAVVFQVSKTYWQQPKRRSSCKFAKSLNSTCTTQGALTVI